MDALVVGAGFAGSVIARFIAEELNKKVVIIEKRNHIAGNMYDYIDENGILVQKYGPHIFHTNDEEVMNYIKRFADWEDYKLECMVYMNDKFTPSPFNFKTIDDYFDEYKAKIIKENLLSEYPDRDRATIIEMLNSKNEVVKEYANFLFENDYSLYTAKQWGISPKEIDISVLKRVPVLFSYETGYFNDLYQCQPKGGYTKFFERILDHENITVKLNIDAKEVLKVKESKLIYEGKKIDIPVIYTGPIDELFNYKYGKLPYRSLKFEFKILNKDSYQDAPVVAYPQEEGYTRITEYKKLYNQEITGVTMIGVEYPFLYSENKQTEPYYPIPNNDNEKLYNKYFEEVSYIKNLILCGRLAEYKYYNMDQIIKKTLEVCEKLK